jgi:hypothetical protein
VSALGLAKADDPGPSHPRRFDGGTSFTTQGLRTGADGTVVVRGLPEGVASLGAWVMAPDGWRAAENAHAVVDVAAGVEAEVVLRLAPLPE